MEIGRNPSMRVVHMSEAHSEFGAPKRQTGTRLSASKRALGLTKARVTSATSQCNVPCKSVSLG